MEFPHSTLLLDNPTRRCSQRCNIVLGIPTGALCASRRRLGWQVGPKKFGKSESARWDLDLARGNRLHKKIIQRQCIRSWPSSERSGEDMSG